MDSNKLELSNTTIYISYWVEMYDKLMILVQYKNKHIICTDASNPLQIKKIVMNASEPQTVSTSESSL
jgi:RNase P/RNase MRP subunit p30